MIDYILGATAWSLFQFVGDFVWTIILFAVICMGSAVYGIFCWMTGRSQ